MFPHFPDALTQDTYPQAWEYVSKKYRRSRKCYVTAQIIERVGHWLFFALMLFLVCGLLYIHLPIPGLPEFFGKAPWFTDTWTRLYESHLQPLSARLTMPRLYGDLAICLALAWGFPFAVCALLAGLVHLVYWPRLVPMAEADTQLETAQALLNTARAAKRNASRAKVQTSSSTAMLFLLTMGVLITLFAVEIIQTNPTALASLLDSQKYLIYACVFAALFSYGIVNYPLVLLLKLLCLFHIPRSVITAMEAHLNSLMPQSASAGEDSSHAFPVTDPASLPQGFFAKEVLFRRLTGFPSPITAETFPKACRWAARKLQWAQRRVPVARVTGLIAHPIYLMVLLVLSFGTLYQQNIPLVNAYLDKAPQIVSLWKQIRLFLYPATASTFQQGLAWARFLYLVPLALSCLAALAVFLVYHPKPRKPDPSDTPAEQARQLCLLLREVKSKSKPPKQDILAVCNILFGAVWLFVAFGLLLFAFGNPETRDYVFDQAHLANLALFLAFLVMALCYRIIALPLTLFLRLICTTWVPKQVLSLSEDWFARCEDAASSSTPENTAALTDEE